MAGKNSFIRIHDENLVDKYTNITNTQNTNLYDDSSVNITDNLCDYISNKINRIVGVNLALRNKKYIDTKKVATVVRDLYFNDICYPYSILPGIDVAENNQAIYLVTKMKKYDYTLKHYLDSNPIQEKCTNLFIQIFYELDRITRLGVHHNDFHSENIMITPVNANNIQINIIDFGDSICINPKTPTHIKLSKLYNLIRLRYRNRSVNKEQYSIIETEIQNIDGINPNIINILNEDATQFTFLEPQNSNTFNTLINYDKYFNALKGGRFSRNHKLKTHNKINKNTKKKKVSNKKKRIIHNINYKSVYKSKRLQRQKTIK